MTALERMKKQQEESAKTEQTTEAPAEQTIVSSYAPQNGETLSERMQFLVSPSMFKAMRKISKVTDKSANLIVVNLIAEYLKSDEAQTAIARYDAFFGDEVTLQHTGRKL